MKYILRFPKVLGDVVPLSSVAEAMARARATAYGSDDFHKPAYDGSFRGISESLVSEVRSGNLKVCDQLTGFALSADEAIAQAKRKGTYPSIAKFVVKPNLELLKKQHPEAEMVIWPSLVPNDTTPDVLLSELYCYFTTLHYLNDWGASAGHSFEKDSTNPSWIDERGWHDVSAEPSITRKETSSADTAMLEQGCTRSAILGARWPYNQKFTAKKLENAMEDDLLWIKDACIVRGKRGKDSSRWNPAKMADNIANQYNIPLFQFDTVMKTDFPKWMDEWDKIKEKIADYKNLAESKR